VPIDGSQIDLAALANKGHETRAIQGWLGHRSITSTAVCTALAPNRFEDF
jgi:type 1 fimbriae regulatory protein FimB/type 1 fimbriae regulatory protein FimE